MGVRMQAFWNVGEALEGVVKVGVENVVGACVLHEVSGRHVDCIAKGHE